MRSFRTQPPAQRGAGWGGGCGGSIKAGWLPCPTTGVTSRPQKKHGTEDRLHYTVPHQPPPPSLLPTPTPTCSPPTELTPSRSNKRHGTGWTR